jgi:predicted nucleotidyltransferase
MYICLLAFEMDIIEKNIEKINELCTKYNVSELYVFGSVLTERFKNESDIDLIVDFDDMDVFNYADNYFDFKFALESVLNRKVDLLEKKAIKNPFLKKSIDSSKKIIYGQRDKNLVV